MNIRMVTFVKMTKRSGYFYIANTVPALLMVLD